MVSSIKVIDVSITYLVPAGPGGIGTSSVFVERLGDVLEIPKSLLSVE